MREARIISSPTLIILCCALTGDRARRIAEVNYSQDKMIERGRALQFSTRKGRRDSKKYTKADKLKKRKTEGRNKVKEDSKNTDDEDEEEGNEGTEEEEGGNREENEEADSNEGSDVEDNREDDKVKVRDKGVSGEKRECREEVKTSEYYTDDADETFGKKPLL